MQAHFRRNSSIVSAWRSAWANEASLELTEADYALVADVGFDPVYGAHTQACDPATTRNPLATQILSGHFGSGDTVNVDADAGKLVFAKG